MTKRDRSKYSRMWKAVVRSKSDHCVWCRSIGRVPDPVLQCDHIVGKPNLILTFMVQNGMRLCRTCNCRRKGPRVQFFGNVEYCRWLENYLGKERLDYLLSFSRMNAKNNADVLEIVIKNLEDEYKRLKGNEKINQ